MKIKIIKIIVWQERWEVFKNKRWIEWFEYSQ